MVKFRIIFTTTKMGLTGPIRSVGSLYQYPIGRKPCRSVAGKQCLASGGSFGWLILGQISRADGERLILKTEAFPCSVDSPESIPELAGNGPGAPAYTASVGHGAA